MLFLTLYLSDAGHKTAILNDTICYIGIKIYISGLYISDFVNKKCNYMQLHVTFPVLAHVAKFYGRLRLIRSVLRASKFSVFEIDWKCNF